MNVVPAIPLAYAQNMNKYEKLRISLRYFLLGRQYYQALDALEWGSSLHVGLRKDGKTPEFQHQIEMAHYVRSLLPSLMYPEDTITATLLHDTPEDKGFSTECIAKRYNDRVAAATELSNKHRWAMKSLQFEALGGDAIGSILKGADRSHNLQSMVGVFTREKQLKYIEEARLYFLPMLKKARRLFPQQELAYENIKHILQSQITLLEEINKAEQVAA